MSSGRGDELSGAGDFELNLQRSILAVPLIEEIDNANLTIHDVILELNLKYRGRSGVDSARRKAVRLVRDIVQKLAYETSETPLGVKGKSQFAHQHVFARLSKAQLRILATKLESAVDRPVFRIWPDAEVLGQLNESIRTVKADAAMNAFGARGRGICWAVIDSGIDGAHRHFRKHNNLALNLPLRHVDFTGDDVRVLQADERPTDPNGHGTHVAGILAGEWPDSDREAVLVLPVRPAGLVEPHGAQGGTDHVVKHLRSISGVAPECRLVSLRALDEHNRGTVSNIIAALGYVDKMNRSAQWPLIHGVNLSVGYPFKAEWFACGQSPLCTEVNRLVRSGTPVVTAAGNSGYGNLLLPGNRTFPSGLPLSINDPGNAELAITVGATHREHPHTYGVSYFSSKGPTGDGRPKPDLVAPGERIVSCAAARKGAEMSAHLASGTCDYREESGTSMAAPHVSGALAGFLSIRREFIGEPERLKAILLGTCTDLGRERSFQGNGLLDLMRAIQSV